MWLIYAIQDHFEYKRKRRDFFRGYKRNGWRSYYSAYIRPRINWNAF